jgi:hypothetical protein
MNSIRPTPLRRLLFLPLLAVIAGCTAPRQAQQTNDLDASFTKITLSQEQIHSPSGDMSARLPEEWVLLDPEKLESPQVFSMACNPEYTLSLIFSEVPLDAGAKGILSRDGLRGLCEASFQRRVKRSSGRAEMVGDVEEFSIGKKRFGAFTYTTDSNKTLTRIALFNTSAHIYECAITQLPFRADDLPGEKLLRTVHQIILGSIESEW